MIPHELADNARSVDERLTKSTQWQWAARDESELQDSAWFLAAQSSIAVLLGGSDARHVQTSGVSDYEETFDVAAVVVSDDRLIDVVAKKAGREEPVEWQVTARSFAGLVSVGVKATANPWDDRLDTKWPDVREVQLTFADGREVALVPEGTNSQDRERLYELADALLGRLD
jgi:hypothetical protein